MAASRPVRRMQRVAGLDLDAARLGARGQLDRDRWRRLARPIQRRGGRGCRGTRRGSRSQAPRRSLRNSAPRVVVTMAAALPVVHLPVPEQVRGGVEVGDVEPVDANAPPVVGVTHPYCRCLGTAAGHEAHRRLGGARTPLDWPPAGDHPTGLRQLQCAESHGIVDEVQRSPRIVGAPAAPVRKRVEPTADGLFGRSFPLAESSPRRP